MFTYYNLLSILYRADTLIILKDTIMSQSNKKISSLDTMGTFVKVGACSQTLCNVINRAFDHPSKPEEKASMPLAGGIMQHGYQCGMLWGSALAAGAQAHRQFGSTIKAQAMAMMAAQRLVQSFYHLKSNINCVDITGIDKSSTTIQMIMYFLIKGGTIDCFRLASKYAPMAFYEINTAFSEEYPEDLAPPISCTALLAEKLGLSDYHTVMIAGLAGGIGLCGGACGALGAAIWVLGLKSKSDKLDFNNPDALALIGQFLELTDMEFECSKIVGHKFESIKDHAQYLCDGGCTKIIEFLANP